MQHVFCTGNLTEKIQYERLKSLAPNVYVTRGEFDTVFVQNNNLFIFKNLKKIR